MSKRDREEIKQLETIKSEIEAKLSVLKLEKGNLDREITINVQSLKSIEQKLNEIKTSGKIVVSEHAIIRYVERVLGIDIDEIVKKVLTEEVERNIEEFGNGVYTVNNCEFKIKVHDGVVVTVFKE